MNTKVCTKCKVEKPKSDFYPTKTKFGNPSVNPSCKQCDKLYFQIKNKERRQSRPKAVIEDLEGEIWVPVKGFENKYEVSNLGRVKSLDRWVFRELVGKDVFMEKKLLAISYQNGYPSVTLYGKTSKEKYPTPIYHLVFFSFNRDIDKKEGFQIDHIDQDRKNTNLSNLQYITARDNCIKRSLHNKKTSIYPGVSPSTKSKKWQTGIRCNGKRYSLGHFFTEEQAARAYQVALSAVKNGTFSDELRKEIRLF